MIFQESESVELKSAVVDDIKKEIIAFANCEGGKVYIGVRDDGSVLGVDDPDGVALQVSNMVRDAIKPDITMFLHYETIEENGKKIVLIDVQQGTERPYYIAKKGLRPEGVYVRQGYSSAPATNAAIRRMIKETDGDRFEEMRSLEQNLTFEAAAKKFAEYKLPFGIPQMKTLGLMSHDGIYTNLGLLLSDQCVHTIKVAVFQGTTQSEFKDRREFSGSLFQQMDGVYDYIDFCNQTHSAFSKLRRIDQRDYPEAAVRESLLNLLVHREYSFRASAFISLYTDRLEFTSIGGLVRGISLQDILMGISVCRNAKLANVFYRLELIEAYGTGIRKIMESYEGSGLKPEIETSDNAFKIILPNRNANTPKKEEKNESAEEKPSTHLEKALKEDSPENQIIALAEKTGSFSRKDAEAALGVSQSTCGRLLKKMISDGFIMQTGQGRATRYVVRK